jgi:hypothetical protein
MNGAKDTGEFFESVSKYINENNMKYGCRSDKNEDV